MYIRMNSNAHCGLWVVMVCSCRFINFDKCTFWWGMLIEGGYARVGAGVYGKPLYLPLNFAVILKLL